MDEYSQWKGWTPEQFGRFSKRENRYYRWHVERVCGRKAGLRVLEIGFGNGAFMGWLRANGHEVKGVESNPKLVESARLKGFQAWEQLEAVPGDQHFDLIAAFDVAEHIPASELPGFLRTLRARCAPGGRLLLRYPNGDSAFGLLHQNGDLTHLTAIGRNKMLQLASMSGWQVVHTGDAPWWADQHHSRSFHGAMRALLRQLFERLVCYVYFNSRLDLRPNMVTVLAPAER
jgi:2-polyprenyl-3-methyl-5-hydroxy-6-metoxy-1,4-benzoquinol methylase